MNIIRNSWCAIPAVGMMCAVAAGQQLLWDTTGGQVNFTTSESSRGVIANNVIVQDTEVADDFLAFGAVTRVVMHGTNCSICGLPPVSGVFVRFFAWTADGPGPLQQEFFLDGNDPNFVYDHGTPRLLDITLPGAFQADGWQFVAVQLAHSGGFGYWSMVEANRDNPTNASVHFRDNLTGGDWAQEEFFGQPEFSDFSIEIYGTASAFISSLSTPTADRSGRVVLYGSGFGTAPADSTVLINGQEAIVTQRLGGELHAYVPESASLGVVDVQVLTKAGASNTVPLTVTLRQPDGLVQWRFQTDDTATRQFIAGGPDGTLYTSDGLAVYAVGADGALLWVSTDAWGGRPISIGPDGTVYTGLGHAQSAARTIVALNPDGSTLWTYTPVPQGSLLSGPNVGPDGNIYAVQEAFDSGGLGAFSLDPDGNLLWSEQGDPLIHSDPGDNSEVKFGADRMYTGVVTDASTAPVLWTFDLDGDQLWTTWQFQPQAGGNYPVVAPFDRVMFKWGQTGMRELAPDGVEEWITLHPNGASFVERPAVDSLGNVYTGDFIGVELWSLDPNGVTRWVQPSSGELLDQLGVSPDDAVIVAGGSGGFGQPGWVRGYDTADGAQRWHLDLPFENGAAQSVTSMDPIFTPNGSTAYVTTQFAGDVNQYGYLWAITLFEPPVVPGDVDGDGVVGILDMLALLGGWGPCPGPCPPSCAADLDDDCAVGITDLLVLLANWG